MSNHWNYRVLYRSSPLADTGDICESYEIIEVYYEDGEIVGWTEASLVAEDLNGLRREANLLGKIASAAAAAELVEGDDPMRVLTIDDLPGGSDES